MLFKIWGNVGKEDNTRSRSQWTEEEENILLANYQKGIKYVAKLLPNRTYASISIRASKLGVQSVNRRWTDEEIAILEECVGHMSYRQIADKLGTRSLHSVASKAKSMGISREQLKKK